MATQRGRFSTPPNPIAAGNITAAERIAYAKSLNRQDAASANDNATQAMAASVPKYALPAGGTKGMSPADQANIARSVATYQRGGHMAPNIPQMGVNAPETPARAVAPTFDKDGNIETPPDNSTKAAPASQPRWTGPSTAYKPGPGSGETRAMRAPDLTPPPRPGPNATAGQRQAWMDKVASINSQAGQPLDTLPQNQQASATQIADNAATVNAGNAAKAGVPTTVDTQYGKAGVSYPPQQNWQQQLVAKYPTLGIAGHPDNVAFVKAYKDAAKNGTPDHFTLADSIVGPNSDQPTPEGQVPQFGVPNALQPQNRTASTAQTVGKAIHDAPGVVSKTVGDAVGGVIKSTVGAAKNFYAGLTGNPNANTGANSMDPPVIPGGTQSPKQIAYQSAKSGLNAQQNTADTFIGPTGSGGGSFDSPPSYAGPTAQPQGTAPSYQMPKGDAHADIHAATVKAITTAGNNAHTAVNSSALNPTGDNDSTAIPSGAPQSPGMFTPTEAAAYNAQSPNSSGAAAAMSLDKAAQPPPSYQRQLDKTNSTAGY